MNLEKFKKQKYKTVTTVEGYSVWADSYENSVPDLLDIGMLEQIHTVNWMHSGSCLDLACGTGRTGQWLKNRGVLQIDGIDITPEMLSRAEVRNIYRTLGLGSVEHTGISNLSYDLITMSLCDEHLPTLGPVYKEAARLAAPGARFIVVGMHPFFFMTRMPTHFSDADGNSVAIESHVHLVSDHLNAASASGWQLEEMHEGVIDDEWIKIKPKWKKLKGHPVNYVCVWRCK
jgi:SAM-dependent methyltransferase